MIYVGVSGWTYPGWRGVFYPKGLPQRRELEYASRHLNSIEVNGTFYSLQSPTSFRRWRDETPDDFVFALKGGRYITHMKKLENAETALANFFASGVLEFGRKLGPILWQLPPWFRFDPDKVARFLDLLPRDTKSAARLAQHYNRRLMKHGVSVEAAADRKIRHAFEVRHDSFRVPEFVALLRRAGVALVISDAPKWPRFEEVTADFLYLRLHGSKVLYESGYDDTALDHWASRIARWAEGGEPGDARRLGRLAPRRRRDVYAYFDNDAKVRAPADAQALAHRLKVPVERAAALS